MAPLDDRGRRAATRRCGTRLRSHGYRADPRRRRDLLARRAARRSTAAGKHDVEVVVDRVVGPRRRPQPDRRQRRKRPVARPRRAARRLSARRAARAALAGEDAQPASRLRPVRPELRAAHAAQFLVQQLAGLVSRLRRAGHADRRQPGRPASRSQADAGRRRRRALARSLDRTVSRWMLAGPGRRHRRPARRALRRSSTPATGGSVLHGTGEQLVRGLSARRREPPTASSRCSASSTRASTPRWKRPRGCRRRCGRSWSTWSTRWNARPAAAAGCATTPRPSASASQTIDELCRHAAGPAAVDD